MKPPETLCAEVRRRLERTWSQHLFGEKSWPHRFSLGAVAKGDLETGWGETFQPLRRRWSQWASEHPVTLEVTPKRVYSTVQDIPVAVWVATIEDAAWIVGGDWPARIEQAAPRAQALLARQPVEAALPRVLRATDSFTETEFALLLEVADWWHAHAPQGLTPRQVPIPGVHAKWLDAHHSLLLTLTGRDTLGLLPAHPARVHFTYLDPAYRATGQRLHDSATVGDTMRPAYIPEAVIVSENKDTALHFPELAGGIAVEGSGFGGKTAAAFPWLSQAPRLYYWGDMDAHGYEILDGWRADGMEVTSILMDLATFEEFEKFGTNSDAQGGRLGCAPRKPLPHLTAQERQVYERLTDPDWTGHRRLEQERIPLPRARSVVGHHDPAQVR